MVFGDKLRVAFALMVAGLYAGILPGAVPQSSDKLLLRAASAVRKQERAVRNIRFSSFSVGKFWAGAKLGMMSSGGTRFRATHDGLPLGKCRITVQRQLSPWTNGAAAFYASAFGVAYNGRVGTFLQTMSGTPKKMSPAGWGHICGHMPRNIVELDDGAWNSSIFGYTSTLHFGNHPRFSAYISPGQKLIKARVQMPAGLRYLPVLRAGWKYLGGVRCLRIVRFGPMGKAAFFLDPLKGYSILQCDWYGWAAKRGKDGKVSLAPNKWVRTQFRVEAFSEPLGGVFFPQRVAYKSFVPRSRGERASLFSTGLLTVSHVRVNDPKVNARTYVIAFPRGTMLTDSDTGQVVQIGGSPQQQLKEINIAVRRAK